MAAIKPLNLIAQKWADNSSRSKQAYTDGVKNPRRAWAASAAAADEARKAGLAAADARNAFVTGVNSAGDAKWSRKAQAVGPDRFASGVRVAQPEFTTGFTPYHAVIGSVNLPPRGPKGSPENIARVTAITEALHNAKTA